MIPVSSFLAMPSGTIAPAGAWLVIRIHMHALRTENWRMMSFFVSNSNEVDHLHQGTQISGSSFLQYNLLTRVLLKVMYITHHFVSTIHGLKIQILGHSVLHNYLVIAFFGPKYCTLQLLVPWQFYFHSSSLHLCPTKVTAMSCILTFSLLRRQFFHCVKSVKR